MSQLRSVKIMSQRERESEKIDGDGSKKGVVHSAQLMLSSGD
jgi:hypothetical protein